MHYGIPPHRMRYGSRAEYYQYFGLAPAVQTLHRGIPWNGGRQLVPYRGVRAVRQLDADETYGGRLQVQSAVTSPYVEAQVGPASDYSGAYGFLGLSKKDPDEKSDGTKFLNTVVDIFAFVGGAALTATGVGAPLGVPLMAYPFVRGINKTNQNKLRELEEQLAAAKAAPAVVGGVSWLERSQWKQQRQDAIAAMGPLDESDVYAEAAPVESPSILPMLLIGGAVVAGGAFLYTQSKKKR
jgi:hypothetical protein